MLSGVFKMFHGDYVHIVYNYICVQAFVKN